MDYLKELQSALDKVSLSYRGSGKNFFCELDAFLPVVAAIIRHIGWVSNSKAYAEGRVSTSNWAMTYITQPEKYVFENNRLIITDEDRELAKKAAEEAGNLDKEESLKNTYLHNIRVLATYGVLDFQDMGYAASMISWYERELEKRLTPKDIGNHLGTIGEKLEIEAVVKQVRALDSYYGLTLLHKLENRHERYACMVYIKH